ncbi:hypothetical protein CQW23_07760 [Capsicum baccatum]|uniref:Putative plant transposon protein domain-containing protein n=1 Tax=Capsicum baccatum TaxID=33114 RepID=A0A2G2X709_CAPBA|nr:hypothetical protein CQW23_07760 [Capsicum baccatum]
MRIDRVLGIKWIKYQVKVELELYHDLMTLMTSYHNYDSLSDMSSEVDKNPWVLFRDDDIFLIMKPKGKNSKYTKKVTKGRVPRGLFNEESDYKEGEPLLRKQKKKKIPKKTSPPPPVEMEGSEETDTEPTTSEHIASEQTASKKQESEHAESEKHDSDLPNFEEHESGKPEFEGLATESPSAERQDEKESPIRKIIFDGLRRTNRRVVKRTLFEEKRIITEGLSRYPEVEQKLRDYDLGWTTREGNSFCPTLVREFYTNNQARLESMCKEWKKAADQSLLDKVPVWGVMMDISKATINSFLHGPNFTPQATSPNFYARLKHRKNQQTWLATLIADGEPEWLTNPSKRIFKASLNSKEIFWRVAKHSKWCEAQLKLFAKQFAATLDKRVKAVLEPYKALSGRINELENCFNSHSKERSVPKMVVLNAYALNRDYDYWVTYSLLKQGDMKDWMD